jgi:L-fucose mutarotase
MLKHGITHPDLIRALAQVGHGSRVLIADGNYAVDVNTAPTATRIYLNLAPGLIGAVDVLQSLIGAIPVEAAHGMLTDEGQEPPIMSEYRRTLPARVATDMLTRFAFYAAASDPHTSVVIATGERQPFANLLLIVGYVGPDGIAHY